MNGKNLLMITFAALFMSLNAWSLSPSDFCQGHEQALQQELNEILSLGPSNEYWGDVVEKNQLKILPGENRESFLRKVFKLMRKHNPLGDNKVNYIVIGRSSSLQKAVIKDGRLYPRIMLKSPYSELLVTFNTHPEAMGYNIVEIIRWDGLKGKYHFAAIEFKPDEKVTVDHTGQRCQRCHGGVDLRPNWDSYRAWAGVIPSKDDMLEIDGNGPTPDSRAYLKFLDFLIEEKEAGTVVGELDIPTDYFKQLKGSSLEGKEAILEHLNSNQFYRVPHYPYPTQTTSSSFSKTAIYAGPSQVLFDQLSVQNACRIRRKMKGHPGWPRLEKIFKEKEVDPALLNEAMKKVASMDTRNNVRKMSFQQDFLREYLREVEGQDAESAEDKSKFYASDYFSPSREGYHVIADPGGVRGIPETHLRERSLILITLESNGEDVSTWSLAPRSKGIQSFSFADQFGLILCALELSPDC